MTDDEYYRSMAEMITKYLNIYIEAMDDTVPEKMEYRHNIWLRIMGLMETWEMV